jgi:tetratricopeptide (TPR) repeat protein
MAKEMYDKAEDVLELYLNNISDHASIRWRLAVNYLAQGKYDLAHLELDRVISINPSFYMLGKICEKKGWEGKAIEHYEKFLDLWKDADPGLPEVEDAKERLVKLKSGVQSPGETSRLSSSNQLRTTL